MSVHLIHIGFPKTGTTYLKSWFSLHPGIQYSTDGVLGCASVDDLIRDVGKDTVPPRVRVTSSEGLAVPPLDPRHWDRMAAAQLSVCETLHDLFPLSQILIVTRGYRGVIQSGYSQLVKMGFARSFTESIASPDLLQTVPEIVNYDRVVGDYRRLFCDRVTVLPYELLRDDNRTFLRIIESVLGIDPYPPLPFAENVRLTREELRWYPLVAKTIARVAICGPLQRRLSSLHLLAIKSGALRPLAMLLDRLARSPEGNTTIPTELLDRLRSGSRHLVDEEWHQRYAAEYLR